MPDQGALVGQSEQPRRSARRHNQSLRFVNVVPRCNFERPLAQINFRNRASFKFRPKLRGLLAHILDELWPQNPIGKSRKIFDVRRQRKLPTRLMAVDHKWLQTCARCINRGRQPRAATPDNHHIVHSIAPDNLIPPRAATLQR